MSPQPSFQLPAPEPRSNLFTALVSGGLIALTQNPGELAKLRAYRDRTETALANFCSLMLTPFESPAQPKEIAETICDDLRRMDLWRDQPQPKAT